MRNSRALAFVSCLLLFAALAAAGDLSGRITVSGTPLPGAVVKANLITSNRGPAAVSVTRTGPAGDYLLRGLRNGDYIQTRGSADGFVTIAPQGPPIVSSIYAQPVAGIDGIVVANLKVPTNVK